MNHRGLGDTKILPLRPTDYDALERSYISKAVADAANLFRVESLEGRALMGRSDQKDYSGIGFPYYLPESNYAHLCRLRLDYPHEQKNGHTVRYLAHYDSRMRLYFPRCTKAHLDDLNLPLIITEGEKKCLGLWRWVTEGTIAYLPIGLAGVWGWTGTIGNINDAHGARIQQKGPLGDWNHLQWLHRKVFLLFDTNIHTNALVAAARRGLARELSSRGAEVYLVDLPEAPSVNGCDDYLYHFGAKALEQLLSQALRYDWRKDLIVTDKGKTQAVLTNAVIALREAPEWNGVLSFDEFALRNRAVKPTPWNHIGDWDDQQDRLLTVWLQKHGIMINPKQAGDAADTAAQDHPVHPVREYLDALEWDHIPRIDHWLTTYLKAENSASDDSKSDADDSPDYLETVGAKWLISAVARIYSPGVKADHMLILEGEQGTLKSTAFKTLGEPWFADDIPDLGNKDSKEYLAGRWIIEVAELDAMTHPELSRVKAFLSCASDHFRPPYGRRTIDVPRQCVFAGTVNHNQYLSDETGGRRFWPVKTGAIDIPALKKDRDQLWAEAVYRYREHEKWWLESAQLNKKAAEEQNERYQHDPWEDKIADWIAKWTQCPDYEGHITTHQILTIVLDKPIGTLTRWDQIRVGAILRRLKWVTRGKERPRRYYLPPPPPETKP
jgi:predicted P-loop ATPase